MVVPRLSDLQKRMPTAESLPHLAGIYDSLSEAIEYSQSGKQNFLGSRENQAAIMYRLLCAGESAKQFCDANLPQKRPRGTKRIELANPDIMKVGLSETDWEQLFEIRDHLAHGLHDIDKERVWILLDTKGVTFRDAVYEALKHCASGWLSSETAPSLVGESVARAKRDLNDHYMAQCREIFARFSEPAHRAIKRAAESMIADSRRQLQDASKEYLRKIDEDLRKTIRRSIT